MVFSISYLSEVGSLGNNIRWFRNVGNLLELVIVVKIVNVLDRSFGVRWIFWSRSVGMKFIFKKLFKYSEENKLKNWVICRYWCDLVYIILNDIKEILFFEEVISKVGKLLWWWCVLFYFCCFFNWLDWSVFKEMEFMIKYVFIIILRYEWF